MTFQSFVHFCCCLYRFIFYIVDSPCTWILPLWNHFYCLVIIGNKSEQPKKYEEKKPQRERKNQKRKKHAQRTSNDQRSVQLYPFILSHSFPLLYEEDRFWSDGNGHEHCMTIGAYITLVCAGRLRLFQYRRSCVICGSVMSCAPLISLHKMIWHWTDSVKRHQHQQ